MSNKITKNEIELFAIELLEKQGFQYIYTPNIAPDSDTPMRESFEDIILKEKLYNPVVVKNATTASDCNIYKDKLQKDTVVSLIVNILGD